MAEGSEEERLAVFRRVRDRIKDQVQAELVNGEDSDAWCVWRGSRV